MKEVSGGSRDRIGKRSGIVGLLGNLILVVIKAIAGFLSNSVAITADALNNLTDCASSLVTLIGFSLAARKRDSAHPYGHGRMEYIIGFIISLLILISGATVGFDAVKRLLRPEPVTVTGLTITVLCIGVLGKAWLAWHVGRLNRKISSSALKAMQKDDAADALVTAVTLAGILLSRYTAFPIDGLLGLLVSVVILKTGIVSFSENMVLLLGKGIDPATEKGILKIVAEYIPEEAVEEISLHDYGPENKLAFIKVDLPLEDELSCVSRTFFSIQRQIRQEMQIDATLYWDIPKAAMQ